MKQEHKLLDAAALTALFETELQEAFPADELKPLPLLLALQQQGDYEVHGLFEGDTLLAYALIMKAKGVDFVLLDYLAVPTAIRNGGYGAAMLDILKTYYKDSQGIIVEAEAPAFAETKEEEQLRRRRHGFYLRNGFLDSGYLTLEYGVIFSLFGYFPREENPKALLNACDTMYRTHLPEEVYRKEFSIPWEGVK